MQGNVLDLIKYDPKQEPYLPEELVDKINKQ
jgi:hypothetical protein